MYVKHEVGKTGEKTAKIYLEKEGYKIIEQNYRTKFGEIDIIAVKENTLIFIEVKTRTNLKYGFPSDSITQNKINHIKKAIKYYLYKNKIEEIPIRIDVLEILCIGKNIKINHIKQIL